MVMIEFQIQLPAFIENVRDKLAENLHELWAVAKVDQGWSYGEVQIISLSCVLILSE